MFGLNKVDIYVTKDFAAIPTADLGGYGMIGSIGTGDEPLM